VIDGKVAGPPGFEPGTSGSEGHIPKAFIIRRIQEYRNWLVGAEAKHPRTVQDMVMHLKAALRVAPPIITREWLVSHLATLGDANRRNRLKAFRALDRWLGTKLTYGIKFGSVPFTMPKAPSDEAVSLLIQRLEEPYNVFAGFLAVSGLRAGEARMLTPAHIDWRDRSVILNAFRRTKRTGITFITVQVAEALKSLCGAEDEPIFSFEKRTYQKAFRKTQTGVRAKDLRVWFAAKCLEAGVPPLYIDIMQGRAPKSVLARHYAPAGKETLKSWYSRVEPTFENIIHL